MDLLLPGQGLIIWQLIIFLGLFFLLAKLAWKPILTSLKEREESIQQALDSAENAKKEMAIGLTEKEREAYQEALIFQNSLQKMVIGFQADLIRDEKVLGLKIFEQISKAIQNDPVLKEKLAQKVAQLTKK